MSKVFPTQPSRTATAGRPYAPSHTGAVVVASDQSLDANPSSSQSQARRLTVHNLHSFERREKRLPIDACVDKAPHLKLYHFPERVVFLCSKCRHDGISSDSVAADTVNGVLLCTRCATRVIRPREYAPSRVVPFPSLLSWLNYKPASVMEEVPTDVASRPAEAVAPSGHRVATGMLGGGYSDLRALPATPMTAEVQSNQQAGGFSSGLGSSSTTHPCERVWGKCGHGMTCFFRNAPRSLCVGYLMGLCDGDTAKCSLLHQQVLDLPLQGAAPRPPRKSESLSAPENSSFAEWVQLQQSGATNKALWQLWNNGPIGGLLQTFVAVEAPPQPQPSTTGAGGKLAFNLNDITSALKHIKK